MSDRWDLQSFVSRFSSGRGEAAAFIDFQVAALEFQAVLGGLLDGAPIGDIGISLTLTGIPRINSHAI